MFLKNLFLFYLVLCIPLAALALATKFHLVSPLAFSIGLGLFVLVYQPLLSGLRLVSMDKIPAFKLYHNLIPFRNDRYWSTIFLGK